MKYLTAGESHGKMLVGILEGAPSGLALSMTAINRDLSERQRGYGRGGRMAIESDTAEIVAGVRNSVTTGAPIAVTVLNKDYQNWESVMNCEHCDVMQRVVTQPRPGHADYLGCKKYGHDDARNILERASARNTASVVALGAVAKQFLGALGVRIASYVAQIGTATETMPYGSVTKIRAAVETSDVRTLTASATESMKREIDRAKAQEDTVGGRFVVVVSGLKPCVGTCMNTDQKLDFMLMGAIGGLQGVKEVSIGDGGHYADTFGTVIHDAMYRGKNGEVVRKTNHAGGLEGGMTNGEDLVISATFKPIPTTMKGLPTVDLRTGKEVLSSKERSDVCAVPAAGVVGEALVALTLMQSILTVTGGDTMKEITERWNA